MLTYLFSVRQSMLFRDPLIRHALWAAGIINILHWGFVLWAYLFFLAGKDFILLHSTIYFGVDLAGFKYRLFFYPFLGLGVSLLNSLLVVVWGKRDVFLARGAGWATVGLQILFLIASIFIIVFLNA